MQHEPPPEPPVATGAVWDGSAQVLTVSFDQQLVDGLLDASNWSVLIPFSSIVASEANATGSTVVLQFAGVSGPTDVVYDPPPFDVVGVNGLAAEAFSLAM